MIDRLLAALAEAGLDASVDDVQDALWLALRVGDFDPPAWRRPLEAGTAAGPVDQPPTGRPPEEAQTDSGEPEPLRPRRAPEVVDLGLRPSPGARPVRVAGVSALPGALDIARALKPLRRRVPSRDHQLLDEEATAERTARDNLWIPVLRPTPARWLELALVVDGNSSMAIWQRTATDLQRLLERQGAFRNVRAWTLTAATGPAGRVRLHRRLGEGANGPPREPDELLDPSGTRLILVLSDGVSPAWREEPLRQVMARWSRAGPVAVLHVLPERLWSRAALRTQVGWLCASRPGAPSAKLRARPSVRTWTRRELPVPVVELSPDWLGNWSALVAGPSDTWTPGAVSFFDQPPEEPAAPAARPPQAEPVPPRARVERFRAAASPTAYHLACYLAAVHLTVPVMHLVQRVMLPTSGLHHLAEVFLSGLLKQLPPRLVDGAEGEVEYDFVDGVCEVLFNGVLRSDAAFVRRQVGIYIEQHDPSTRGLVAFLDDPSGAPPVVSERSQPFATVAAAGLRRAGLLPGPAPGGTGPGRRPIVPLFPSSGPADKSEPGTVRIGLLGATGSGKTTFLAALEIATFRSQSHGNWIVHGRDEASTDFLTSSLVQLRQERKFPAAGLIGRTLSWTFTGDLTGTPLAERRWGRRGGNRAEFTVELQDLPGGFYLLGEDSELGRYPVDAQQVIDHLATSQGLVYLFDPVRELRSGDSFRYFGDIMDLVVRRRQEQTGTWDPRLPHHLAICVTKFDDPEVFEPALEAGWVSWEPTGIGAPRVLDHRAARFFDWICRQRPDGTATAVRNRIGSYFHADRVAHFVSSAIGFYAPRGGRVNPRDYRNVDEGGDDPRIRGAVRPINVLEPFIWLERSIRAAGDA